LPVIAESRRISCKDKLFSFVAGSLSSDKNEKKKNTNAEQGSAHKKVFGKFYGERAAQNYYREEIRKPRWMSLDYLEFSHRRISASFLHAKNKRRAYSGARC